MEKSSLASAPAPARSRHRILYLSIFIVAVFSCFWLRDAATTSFNSENRPAHSIHDDPQAPLSQTSPRLLRGACRLRYWDRLTKSWCDSATEASWIDDSRDVDLAGAPEEPLRVFQVHTPPRSDRHEEDKDGCVVELMSHTFGFSYGKPFVGRYKPPKNCKWTNVVMNLTMTSKGRQFDRLAMMFLGDIEVFRTSTAEPTSYGIVSEYIKDMTPYASLLRSKQKIIFELGNLVNDVYTGSFDVTLTATFYTAKPVEGQNPADMILPISAARSKDDAPSHFLIPEDRVDVPFSLPNNTIRAVVSVFASGNEKEEFWYTNVPDSYTETFKEPLPGHSSFREIQVLIDGKLAGVAWPEITVFTGGIVPSLWRPIVGINTFDLTPYDIEITPWLPEILDSKPHSLQIKIVSYDETSDSLVESISNNWITSGRIFVWTDPNPKWKTTGLVIQHYTPDPYLAFSPTLTKCLPNKSHNRSLIINTKARRTVSHLGYIETSTGVKYTPWIQRLEYGSTNTLSENGYKQHVLTSTSGAFIGGDYETRDFSHQFMVSSLFSTPSNGDYFDISADVTHTIHEKGLKRFSDGLNNQRNARLVTELMGSAAWRSIKGGLNATTSQVWGEIHPPRDMQSVVSYGRRVVAEKDQVKSDWERIDAGKPNMMAAHFGLRESLDDAEGEIERLMSRKIW